MNKRIIFYSVPCLAKVSGGPRTRITNFSKAVMKRPGNYFIEGNTIAKIKKTLEVSNGDVLYVESSTNRVKIIDLFCLLILKFKSKTTITYIRDVYIQIFPEEYKNIRGFVTSIANKLSNIFYILISDKFAFPTTEMGKVFFSKMPSFLKKEYFDLPPGTYSVWYNNKASIDNRVEKKIEKIKFLYLGGTNYKYSGFDTFLNLSKTMSKDYKFYILTADNIESKLVQYGLKDKLVVLSLKHEQVIDFLEKEKITFVLHTRPTNNYDDITFPIKIMDCISCGVPFISVSHEPLVSLLGHDYPFFVDSFSETNMIKIIGQSSLDENYTMSLNHFLEVKDRVDYFSQVVKLIENA